MKFSDVSSVRIPEGDVAKIVSGGVTLWEMSVGGMPAGYTQCEYLQLDGGQYVDTGILADINTSIEIVFTRETSSKFYLLGAVSSDNKATVSAYQGGYWRFGARYTTPTVAENTKHSAVICNDNILLNGKTVKWSGTNTGFVTPYSIVVGTSHLANGSINTTRHVGKIYGFKMWNGDTLVADYTPCRDPNGVYGFWDNVARAFRASEGNTEFTGG